MDAERVAPEPQFVCNAEGQPTAVILDIGEYQAMLDYIEDRNDAEALQQALDRSTGELTDWDVVRDRLVGDDLL